MNLLTLKMMTKWTMPLMKRNTMMTELEKEIEEIQPQVQPAQPVQEQAQSTQLQGQPRKAQFSILRVSRQI